MSKAIYTYGATDVGMTRATNQDQFLIADLQNHVSRRQCSYAVTEPESPPNSATLLLVADGMGGHQAGARASELVVEGMLEFANRHLPFFRRDAVSGDDSLGEVLHNALMYCRDTLKQEAHRSPECRGMGTTVTVAVIAWPRLYVAHVGDSRCYRLREGELQQLTRDHTLSQLYRESQDLKAVSKEEAERLNNTLWNVICAGDKVEPEVGRYALQEEDQVLLCSDGLYKELSSRQIQATLRATMDVRTACCKLIRDANQAGGSDNVTAVLARGWDVPTSPARNPLADTVDFDPKKS